MELILEVLIGQLLPSVIDLINRKVPSSRVRFWVSLVVCLFMGVLASADKLTVLVQNPTLPGVLLVLQAGTIIFTSAQVAYKQWYENSVIQAKIRNPLP